MRQYLNLFTNMFAFTHTILEENYSLIHMKTSCTIKIFMGGGGAG